MGIKADIATALIGKIQGVTIANGYSLDVVTVAFDKVKLNITDYTDWQMPAVQVIDINTLFNHEMSRSKTSWFLAVEIALRTTQTIGTADQQMLWTLEEDVKRAIMADPKLGLSSSTVSMIHVKLVDAQTDLHTLEPNYIATLGLEIMYYEPIVRDNC